VRCVKRFNTFLKQGNGGNIINVASNWRNTALLPEAVYCASKAAVISMSKNTAHMYWPDNVRCNVIAPGGIETEIATSMGDINPKGYARLKPSMDSSPPMGTGKQIATVALFLASEDSSYVNGDVLVVDGWNDRKLKDD